jgi:phytoene desaturase
MTPNDFKNDYRSMYGAGFSIEPTLTQSAWFRYHNKHKMIENLYFAGAGTHPGAGLPGVISSAKVVEELITGIEVKPGASRC